MEYFRLRQDPRVPNCAVMQLKNIRNYREAVRGNVTALPRMSATYVNSSKINVYPDLLDRQLFMVKDNLLEVFMQFVQKIEIRDICLLDNLLDVQEIYHIPNLEIVDCIAESSEQGVIILDSDAVEDRDLFRAASKSDGPAVVIVSLLLAESILRRSPTGVMLERITLI